MRSARTQGLPPPVAVSNQLSLLRMEHPVYPGCHSARDRASCEWFTANDVALIAWSSQGRGVHTALDAPERLIGSDYGPHWYSHDNVTRLERAVELARRRGVQPVNVALAWVLHRPFTVFPVIGPRVAAELHDALPGLALDLSPDELAWLDVGEGPR